MVCWNGPTLGMNVKKRSPQKDCVCLAAPSVGRKQIVDIWRHSNLRCSNPVPLKPLHIYTHQQLKSARVDHFLWYLLLNPDDFFPQLMRSQCILCIWNSHCFLLHIEIPCWVSWVYLFFSLHPWFWMVLAGARLGETMPGTRMSLWWHTFRSWPAICNTWTVVSASSCISKVA